LIRAEYGYADEYILSKSIDWFNITVESIEKRKHTDGNTQAEKIAWAVGNLLADKKDRKPLPEWDEIQKEPPRQEEIQDEAYQIDKEEFKSLFY